MSPKNTQPSTASQFTPPLADLLAIVVIQAIGSAPGEWSRAPCGHHPKKTWPKTGETQENEQQRLQNWLPHQYLRFQTHGCDKLGTNHGNVLRVEIPPHICQGLLRIVTHPNFMQGLLSNGTLTTANLPTKSACMSGDWAPFTPTKDRLGWTNIRLTHSQAGHIFYLRPAQKHHSHLVCLLDRSKQPQPHMIWMVRSVWWWIISTSCTNALRHQLLNLLERLRVL